MCRRTKEMLDWIKMFLDPKGAMQELALDPEDLEIEREKPEPPESRYISESGKVTKGPKY